MTTVLDHNQDIQLLFKQASQAHSGGDFDRAKQLYSTILSIKPDSAAAFHDLGLLMLEKGRPQTACLLLKQAISIFAADADYYFHLGEALSASGQASEAIDNYNNAIHLAPDQADYYFSLGNACVDIKNYPQAVNAYEAAVKLNPEDFEAYNNLGNAYYELGDNKRSSVHYKNAVSINPEYAKAHLNLSLALKTEHRYRSSLYHAQQAVKYAPQDIECSLGLAGILFDLEYFKQAKHSYVCALELDSLNTSALRGYAKTLMHTGDLFKSLRYFEKAVSQSEADESLIIEMSSCLIRLQHYTKAKQMLETLLTSNPRHPQALFNYGLCLQAEGDFTSALIAHQTAWKIKPDLTQSIYHICCNGRYKSNSNDIQKMQKLLTDRGLSINKQINLHFSLAKIFEKQNNFDQAFEHFKLANVLKAEKQPFNLKQHSAYVERIKSVFTKQLFSQHSNLGHRNARITFIVGMPRSGSTLIEQILASHPSVNALGEHLALPVLINKLPNILNSNEQHPECIVNISPEISAQLVGQYLDYTGINFADDKMVTDKMLGNFLRLGVIALMFPNARVIHCQRDPLDTCVSCYTQNFAQGLRFSTRLHHLGRFYQSYKDLMQHWSAVLPLQMTHIDYEQLVLNKDHSVRQLLSFCDLPWDYRCLEFHKTRRRVSTASFWQVKQALYTDSIGRWKRYEKHLGPLYSALSTSKQMAETKY